MAAAFFFANSVMAASVPDQRTRHLPDASQKASPNLTPGTAPTRASWMSSTDLMKWVWPRMKLVSSGFSIFTVMSCMVALPANRSVPLLLPASCRRFRLVLLHPRLDDPFEQGEGHRLVERELEVALRPGVPCDGLLDGLVAADRRVQP